MGRGKGQSQKKKEVKVPFFRLLLTLMLSNKAMYAPCRNEHRRGEPVREKWRPGFQQGTWITALSSFLNNTHSCAFFLLPVWSILNSSVIHFNSNIFQRSHQQQAVVWKWQFLHRISRGISGWAEEMFVGICSQVYVELVCVTPVLAFLLSQALQYQGKKKKKGKWKSLFREKKKTDTTETLPLNKGYQNLKLFTTWVVSMSNCYLLILSTGFWYRKSFNSMCGL